MVLHLTVLQKQYFEIKVAFKVIATLCVGGGSRQRYQVLSLYIMNGLEAWTLPICVGEGARLKDLATKGN